MSTKTPAVIVVGGGVAGLATAWLLRELGRESGREISLSVLESRPEPGGSTRTDLVDGYTCEWGPNGFLDNEPATLDLMERLGLTSDLVKADESSARRFIYYNGKMRELPTGPRTFLTSDILPFPAKLRMGLEIFIPAKRDGEEETVYSFGRRRLGKAFADYLLDPMVSGIFAGNTHELSLPAVFPKMADMETQYGGLFKALIAKGKEAKKTGRKSGGPAGAAATLHTFRQGMGQLTSTLAAKLAEVVQTSTPVQAVKRQGQGFAVRLNGEDIVADAVVLACPSFAAAQLIEDLAPQVALQVGAIPHAPVDVVCHGHPSADLKRELDGFGVLVPRSERIRSLGSLWCNSIFPGQAPQGHVLLRTLIGGAHDPAVVELSNDDLEAVVQRDHERLYGLNKPPEFRRIFRHPKGIAQYTMGHLKRVEATEKLEDELPGLYFTGASYRGVSVNGCAKDAFRTAQRFWQYWSDKQ